MTKKELLQVFQDFSEQHGETYEERCIYDNHFGDLADVLLRQPSSAIDLIVAEREKQISKGYTVEHDEKEYPNGRMAHIASALLMPKLEDRLKRLPDGWNEMYWTYLCGHRTHKDRVRIAAGILAAELERIIHLEKEATNEPIQ